MTTETGSAGAVPAAPPAPEPVIRMRALTKRYDSITAVDRLTLEIQPGEVFGLLGPNGAGKTTTVLMLLGLSEPTSGEARVLGLDPTREPLRIKRHVGYLPDNVGFYGGMTGRQNLRYTARLNDLRKSEGEQRINEALEQVGLTEAADRKVDGYSRGMRQRLGIADALIKDPRVLILDEPTTSIDPEGVAELLTLIRRLADERGLATLLSSHLLEQVQSICDRVGIFVGGRLIAHGTIEALAAREGGGAAIDVGVDGASETAEAILRETPGVTDVERIAGHPGRWTVRGSSDLRAAVLARLLEAGLPVNHLNEHRQDLSQIYRRLMADAAAGRLRRMPEDLSAGDAEATRSPSKAGRPISDRGPRSRGQPSRRPPRRTRQDRSGSDDGQS